jgi:hypothetical protein
VLTSRPSAKETGIYLFDDKADYYSDKPPVPLAELKVDNNLKVGELLLKGSNESTNVFLGSSVLNPDYGYLSVHDSSGSAAAKIEIVNDGGQIGTFHKGRRITHTGIGAGKQGLNLTYGAGGNVSTTMGSSTSTPNIGFVAVYNESARLRAIQTAVADAGYTSLYGPKGNSTVILSSVSGKPNHGLISVYDDAKNSKAYMYVGYQGEGIVGADYMQANLFQSYTIHPKDSAVYIAYTALQGAEAASFFRGTARLINGTVTVNLPDHFKQTVSENKITVTLTPLSADSKGIAVLNKTNGGFVAKELFAGTGNYDFDYEVKGLRRGYENEPVLVNLTEDGNTSLLKNRRDMSKNAIQLQSLSEDAAQPKATGILETKTSTKAGYSDLIQSPKTLTKKKPHNTNH